MFSKDQRVLKKDFEILKKDLEVFRKDQGLSRREWKQHSPPSEKLMRCAFTHNRYLNLLFMGFLYINRQTMVEWFKEQWNNIRLKTQRRFKL